MTTPTPGVSPGAYAVDQSSPGRKRSPRLRPTTAILFVVVLMLCGLVGFLATRKDEPVKHQADSDTPPLTLSAPSSITAAETAAPTTTALNDGREILTDDQAKRIFLAWTTNSAPLSTSLHPYFGDEPASPRQVQADADRERSTYSSSNFEVTVNSITPEAGRMRVELTMDYLRIAFDSSDTICGSVITRMWLTESGEGWLVSGIDEVSPEVNGIGYRSSGASC